jgi:hypothetical protein
MSYARRYSQVIILKCMQEQRSAQQESNLVNSAVSCLFHAKADGSPCGMLHLATAKRLRTIWGCEERCRTAWHWDALYKLSHSFVNRFSPHPHSKPCISREIVLLSVTQQQVDADMRYVTFIQAWNTFVTVCATSKAANSKRHWFYFLIFF